MADRNELAFLKNALGVTGTDPQEQTALENLLFTRLLTAGLTIDNTGAISAPSMVANVTNATGTLPVGHGGTGLGTLPIHGVLIGNATGTVSSVAVGTTGQVLQGNTGADPTWGTAGTGTVTATSGNLTASALVVGNGSTDEKVLASLGTTTTVLHGNAAGLPTFGAVALAADVSGQLPVANGGTALASGTSGGVLAYTASGTLASSAALTAHGVVIGGGAGAAPTSTGAGTSGQVLTSNGASADPTFQGVTGTMTKLTASADSGTDTSAGATTVATCAISGLTAKDRLIVYATLGSTTALTATPSLRSATDAVSLGQSSGNVNGGTAITFKWEISQRSTSATTISTFFFDGAGGTVVNVQSAFTTSWQGSWSLGLRHAGVTATGTFDYQWAVYKLAGQ